MMGPTITALIDRLGASRGETMANIMPLAEPVFVDCFSAGCRKALVQSSFAALMAATFPAAFTQSFVIVLGARATLGRTDEIQSGLRH